MWQKCVAHLCDNTEIEYDISDGFFKIRSSAKSSKIKCNSSLWAVFSDDKELEIGYFNSNDGIYTVDKKYSLSYLENNNININLFSHFTIKNEEGISFTAKKTESEENDASLKRARDILGSLKEEPDPQKANDAVCYILQRTSLYEKVNIPVLPEFTWYKIDNPKEYFSLSSIEHLICSEGYINCLVQGIAWYFGVCNETRIYAVGCKREKGLYNPFTNASDCAIEFNISDSGEVFYVVGIMILDDGQYFCRLT